MNEFQQFVGLRISTQPGAVPTDQQISGGELAFNLADGKIFALLAGTVTDITDRYSQSQIDSFLSGKANVDDLAEIAISGSYNDLSDTPTLGTAAAQDADAFDPAGTAANIVDAHTADADPHPQYQRATDVGTIASRDIYISDQPPDDAIGNDGDIWLQHWST